MKLTSAPPSSPSNGEPIDTIKFEMSLSIIFAVAELFGPTAPIEGAEIVAITVSVFSARRSSMTSTTTSASEVPSGMENDVTFV